MILIILIIVIFISFVVYTCIKSSSYYYNYNQSNTEQSFKYHLDEGFMLYNYMNYLQCKEAEEHVPVHNQVKYHKKQSKSQKNSRTSNLKVIRGNKRGS